MAANIQEPPKWPALWECPKCHQNTLNFDSDGDFCMNADCDYMLDFDFPGGS